MEAQEFNIMRNIVIKSVSIEEWRGQSRKVDFSTSRTHISGFNGEGKSSIHEAILWCLTGVDTQNRSNYKLFDENREYTPNDNPVASVECVFVIDNETHTFKRTAQQKFVRRRGQMDYEKASPDNYSFSIDGFELNSTQYKSFIELHFCPIDKLKLILNIHYYEMIEDWRELRKHFADIVGEIRDEDFNGDYSCIASLLLSTQGDVKSCVNALAKSYAQLKEEISLKTNEIEALKYSAHNYSTRREDAVKMLKELEVQLEELDKKYLEQLASIQSLKDAQDKAEKEIADCKAEISKERQDYVSLQEKQRMAIEYNLDQAQRLLSATEDFNRDASSHRIQVEQAIKYTEQSIENTRAKIQKLLDSRATVLDEKLAEDMLKCPICGAELSDEKKKEAIKAFEDSQREKIFALDRELYEQDSLLKQQQGYVSELKEQLVRFQNKDTDKFKKDIERHTQELEKLRASYIPFELTDKYKELQAQLNSLIENKPVIPTLDGDLLDKKMQLHGEHFMQKQIVEESGLYDELVARIKAEEQCRTLLIQSLAEVERQKQTLIERERERAEIIRKKANKFLQCSEVIMTNTNKKGEIVDCCSLTLKGVDRAVVNNASKTCIGVELSRCFQRAYNIKMPIFVDDIDGLDMNNRDALFKPDYQYVVMEVANTPITITYK